MTVKFVHTLLRARDYQERPEFDKLCDWWCDGGQGVCSLTGIGGAGKTALVDRFLRVLPSVMAPQKGLSKNRTLREPAGVFVFSFYKVPNAELLFAHLSAWLRGRVFDGSAKRPSYEQTLGYLERSLETAEGNTPILLVLDGLEKVQEDGARVAFGLLLDKSLADLLDRASDGSLKRLAVLITTRFRLTELWTRQNENLDAINFKNIEINHLSVKAAVDLLRSRGVVKASDLTLRRLAKDLGYHALTVDLMGGYVSHFCGGDLSKLEPEPKIRLPKKEPAESDETQYLRKQEQKLARVAQRYRERFKKKDPATLLVLESLCLFRLGSDVRLLETFFSGKLRKGTAEPGFRNLTGKQLREKCTLLTKMHLLEESRGVRGKRHDIVYTVHPAVRDGFLAGLGRMSVRSRHETARRAMETRLKEYSFGRFASDETALDLLEEITYHALKSGYAEDAFEIYWNQMGEYENLGWRLGDYKRCERVCRALSSTITAGRASDPKILKGDMQADCVAQRGLCLLRLGELVESERCHKSFIELSLEKGYREEVSLGYQNLAEVYLLRGQLRRGLDACKKALYLAKQANDKEEISASYVYMGQARVLLGQLGRRTLNYLAGKTRRKQQSRRDDRKDWVPYSFGAIWTSILYMRLGKMAEARQLVEDYKIRSEQGYGLANDDIPRCDIVLAELAHKCGDLRSAVKFLETAHGWALARGEQGMLCWSELVRARILLSQTRKYKGKKRVGIIQRIFASCSKGLRIARECGYGIYHIDLLMCRAQAWLICGDPNEAEADVRLALAEGVPAEPKRGKPFLLAASNIECGYTCGEADANYTLGEALLLRAAQILGQTTFAVSKLDELPEFVQDLIREGEAFLRRSVSLRKRMRDPREQEGRKALKSLMRGSLTQYPRQKVQISKHKLEKSEEAAMRNQVFISYSHKDSVWLEKLLTMLTPVMRNRTIDVWADTRIAEGAKWRDEIKAALERAKVAVLLVSDYFLESDFINKNELPKIFKAVSQGELTILWIYLSDCMYEETPIAEYQAAQRPLTPLDIIPAAKRKRILKGICQVIKAAASS